MWNVSLDFLLTKVVILGKRKVLESCVSTKNYSPISLLSDFSKCFGEMIEESIARSKQWFLLKSLEQDFIDFGEGAWIFVEVPRDRAATSVLDTGETCSRRSAIVLWKPGTGVEPFYIHSVN